MGSMQRQKSMNVSHRAFLLGLGSSALVASCGSLTRQFTTQNQSSSATGFRFAFLSDTHLRRELRSPEGLAAALDAVEGLSPRPAFIVTGGDLCHNLRDQGLEEVNAIAGQFVQIWNSHTSLPTYYLLGNHDPAGWRKGEIPSDHPQFGFNLLLDKLGMKGLSYSRILAKGY
jgi:predicted MPP superfamily phosphohydrolase